MNLSDKKIFRERGSLNLAEGRKGKGGTISKDTKVVPLFKEKQHPKEEVDIILGERDRILASMLEGISFFGGAEREVAGAKDREEKIAIHLKWRREVMDLYDNEVITLDEARRMMKAMIADLNAQSQERRRQIESFLGLRAVAKERKIKCSRILISKSAFMKATFEERRAMVVKLSSMLTQWKEPALEEIEERQAFFDEMEAMEKKAKAAPPSESWVIYFEMERKLKALGRKYASDRLADVRAKKSACEFSVVVWLSTVEKELSDLSGEPLTDKKAKKFNGYLKALSSIPGVFKLESKIGERLVDIELRLLEILKTPQPEEEGRDDEEKTSSEISAKEKLLQSQLENEFVRRMFAQIAALSMCMGEGGNEHKAQRTLLRGGEAVAKEEFGQRQKTHLAGMVAQETGRGSSDIKVTGEGQSNANLVSATSGVSLRQIGIRRRKGGITVAPEKKLIDQHQTMQWEMTRIAGLNPWTTSANEKYLRGILSSGQHLMLTDNYRVVSLSRAKQILMSRALENLDQFPGKTASEKKAGLLAMKAFISEAATASPNFAATIFSYTNLKGDIKKAA